MRSTNGTVAKALCAIVGGLLLALGGAIWSGFGVGVARAHIILGVFFAIVLSAIAVALAARRQAAFGYTLLLFVIVMTVFGVAHPAIFPGPYHWIVRVVHVLIGATAGTVGYRFAARLDVGVRRDAPSRRRNATWVDGD